MNVVVLLKQVPDTEAVIQIAEDKTSINTQDVKWVINPYDELAVEEALRIKESQGSGTVVILTVGPDRAVESIRTALAMGADEGVLVDDPAAEGANALGTAKVLAAALREIPHDLIIAGMRAVDDDDYQVPAAVAEFLDIPHVSMVIKVEIQDTKILPGIMKAKKKPLMKKTLTDLGVEPSELEAANAKSRVKNLSFPPERTPGKIVEGETPEAKAVELVRLLTEEAKVL